LIRRLDCRAVMYACSAAKGPAAGPPAVGCHAGESRLPPPAGTGPGLPRLSVRRTAL